MLTALISAALVGLLTMMGMKLSIAQIAGVVIGVKIIVVASIFTATTLFYRKKSAKALETSRLADPAASETDLPPKP